MKKSFFFSALLLVLNGCFVSGGSVLGNAAINTAINMVGERGAYLALEGLIKVFGADDGEEEHWHINKQYRENERSFRDFSISENLPLEEIEDENYE